MSHISKSHNHFCRHYRSFCRHQMHPERDDNIQEESWHELFIISLFFLSLSTQFEKWYAVWSPHFRPKRLRVAAQALTPEGYSKLMLDWLSLLTQLERHAILLCRQGLFTAAHNHKLRVNMRSYIDAQSTFQSTCFPLATLKANDCYWLFTK